MARAASPRARTAPAPGARRLPAFLWLKGVLCGAVLMVSPATMIVIAALFAPLVAIVATDASPSRATTRTAILFALAASLRLLVSLWSSGGDVATAIAMARDPRSLLCGWLAIGAAWLLLEVISIVLRLAFEISARMAETRHRSEIETLLAEWGE
ncbi:hypothetical protein FHR90_002141 [Endobacter medicaginis]|uniref:Transmembrane protein n=1 Tax=Endobacter medicaginis TaxID=1181271 RepID=A0A839V1G7_9PROT|nr:hypothetical protein [Endobacter medicaginis]MBB3174300.1 hypothetical protein [Endobacter medicaginis]MCX5476182.1 hypothetical protein [Endobacter medicaginis]NVN29670.1 hypothetical protein [Endobacter medicaginis]